MPRYPQVVIDFDLEEVPKDTSSMLAAVQRKMELAHLGPEVFEAFKKDVESVWAATTTCCAR